MGEVKKFELLHDEYIGIMDKGIKSYGGNQQWFSNKLGYGKAARIHECGCGVIALSDLFLYWGMNLNAVGDRAPGAQLAAEGSQMTKEDYMAYVEYIRDHYIGMLPGQGMFDIQLILAINYYCLRHQIPYKAKWAGCKDDRQLLKEICRMLQEDIPVILLISSPFPAFLYKTIFKQKKIGIPFYSKGKGGTYTKSQQKVKGHFITVTGVYIDKEAPKENKVMLRVASWGVEYYISYYEYCKFVFKYGSDLESRIISIQ